MKPDYGLSLIKSGYDAALQIVFVNWKIWYVIVFGSGEYTTFTEIDCQGERHAVSLDFDACWTAASTFALSCGERERVGNTAVP